MCCRKPLPGFVVALVLLTLAGCARQPATPGPQRIALLRFENLGADSSADWIGRAIPLALETELPDAISTAALHAFDRTLGVRPISAPGVSAERSQALAAGANRIAYGDYWVRGGRLYARLWLADPGTQKILKLASANAPAGDAIGAANALSRQLAAHPAAYAGNAAALRAYAQGIEAREPAQAAARMEEAIAADADFGPAYRSLAELDIQRQDRAAAESLLARALARPGIGALEHARIQVAAAGLASDGAARQKALAALAHVEPRNPRTWQSMGEIAMTRHDYAAAWDAYRHASAIEPENAALLNELAYAATDAGHFDDGAAALRKYRALRPNDANALDSMGDLYLMTNRYREAADYYAQAYKLDPAFNNHADLFKGAMAYAMTGDLAGADDLEKQYVAARAAGHDTGAAFEHAQWLWLTGRRQQAASDMQAFGRTAEARHDNAAASQAYATLAVWSLMAGDRAGTEDMTKKAAALAAPASAAAVAIARFLAQPSAAAAEWQARADRFIANPGQSAVKDEMLGYALLLDRQPKAAKAPLERVYDATGTASNEGLPALIAWCDIESGAAAAAAPLIELTPVPPSTGVSTFQPLWFPRIFELRAQMAEKAGKADDAKRERELFAKLSPQS